MVKISLFLFVFLVYGSCIASGLESSSERYVKTLNNQEPIQTFYVKKRNNNNLKLVLEIGDKLNLEYISDSGENASIKGILTTIDTDWIKVNETAILLSNIVYVSSLGTEQVIFGSLAVGVGAGLMSLGVISLYQASQIHPNFLGSDWSKKTKLTIGGAVMMIGGAGVCALSVIKLIVPRKLRQDKFSFHTITN